MLNALHDNVNCKKENNIRQMEQCKESRFKFIKQHQWIINKVEIFQMIEHENHIALFIRGTTATSLRLSILCQWITNIFLNWVSWSYTKITSLTTVPDFRQRGRLKALCLTRLTIHGEESNAGAQVKCPF